MRDLRASILDCLRPVTVVMRRQSRTTARRCACRWRQMWSGTQNAGCPSRCCTSAKEQARQLILDCEATIPHESKTVRPRWLHFARARLVLVDGDFGGARQHVAQAIRGRVDDTLLMAEAAMMTYEIAVATRRPGAGYNSRTGSHGPGGCQADENPAHHSRSAAALSGRHSREGGAVMLRYLCALVICVALVGILDYAIPILPV